MNLDEPEDHETRVLREAFAQWYVERQRNESLLEDVAVLEVTVSKLTRSLNEKVETIRHLSTQLRHLTQVLRGQQQSAPRRRRSSGYVPLRSTGSYRQPEARA